MTTTITQPTWFQRDGTAAGTLGPPAAYMNVALSLDGRQAAVDRFDVTPGIWLLDPARGTATRATSGALYESTPVWSPDGEQFVFAAARDTPPNLYVKRIGTAGEEERLFRTLSRAFRKAGRPMDASSRMSRSTRRPTLRHLEGFSASGDRTPTRFSRRSSMNNRSNLAQRSMDGVLLERVGKAGVYVTGFPEPVGKWQVSTERREFSRVAP